MSLRAEGAVALAGGLALALIASLPLALGLGHEVPGGLDDPLLQSWQVAWGGHALAHDPLHPFHANAFWPEARSLAFSDPLLGYAPLGLLGSGPGAALLRYDLLFLFTYALAFAGAYLLGRELGLGKPAAVVAGAAFAFSPWRASQAAHLHILSSGGIPLTLFLLARGYRQRRALLVAAGFATAAWQVSLGFSLGLQLLYLLILAGPLIAWFAWLRHHGPRPRRLAAATVLGAAALAGVSLALAQPYLEVLDDHPHARRTEREVRAFSPPLAGFAAASSENVAWGHRTSDIRNGLGEPGPFAPLDEKTIFPGLAVLLLGVAGATWGRWARWMRALLAAAALLCGALSLGLSPGSLAPYRALFELAPGWDGIRTPGRIMTLTTLALALLAGIGAQRLVRRSANRGLTRLRSPTALGVLMAAVVVFEGWSPPVLTSVPDPPRALAAAEGPRLHLPSDRFADPLYMLWSTDGFPALVNGMSGFVPESLVHTRAATAGFPESGRAYLRRLGVRSVVLHPRGARGPARVIRLEP